MNNFFEDYIEKLRRWTLNDIFLILNDDKDPDFTIYIKLLLEVEYKDGSYYTYYGEVKNVINCFAAHWTDVMDQGIKEADRLSHKITKDELLKVVERTILYHQEKQVDFEKLYLTTDEESKKTTCEEIGNIHTSFMENLYKLQETIKKFDTREKVEDFAKAHFPLSLKHKNGLFVITYECISTFLALCIDKIRVSIEEIYNRIRSNFCNIQQDCDASICSLIHQLYDKNKEHLTIFRQDIRSSFDIAEVQRSISIIKDKIEDSKHVPTVRLKEEVTHWRDKVYQFNVIYTTLAKLRNAREALPNEEKVILKALESCEAKYDPAEVDENVAKKLERLHELKLNATKALFTFFIVKVPDRKYFNDRIGTYYVDEYGHQVYVYNYGLNVYHVDCTGHFVDMQKNENDLYYYDNSGRYTIQDGGPLYQIAPCSSQYKVESDIRVKVTEDCGHADRANKKCKMQVKDPNDVEMLPQSTPVDIKGKLDTDTVNYLWENFGHILPDALLDVAKAQPKKPIHYLAHKLLYHKYRRTKAEAEKEKQIAHDYREDIYTKRKEHAIKLSKEWKAKQVKRRRPEESDAAAEWFAHDAYAAHQLFIAQLQYYSV